MSRFSLGPHEQCLGPAATAVLLAAAIALFARGEYYVSDTENNAKNGTLPQPSILSGQPRGEMPPGDGLPDHVSQHIETIAALHARAESQVNFHQRTIETITANLGRPTFLNLVLLFVAGWALVNVFPQRFGLRRFDDPPFFWLDSIIGLGALLLTIIILITQNRQARLAERRAELDLQVNLLAEQKIAKLIGLVEELRRDLPSVRNRIDLEAEAMQEAANPHAVLDALEEKIEAAQGLVEPAEPPRES